MSVEWVPAISAAPRQWDPGQMVGHARVDERRYAISIGDVTDVAVVVQGVGHELRRFAREVWACAVMAQATELGADHGHAQGTWVEVPDEDTARHMRQWEEDGDPLWSDLAPAPLDGQWSDSMTPDKLREELDVDEGWDEVCDEVCRAYEDAHRDAFFAEVERMISVQLD